MGRGSTDTLDGLRKRRVERTREGEAGRIERKGGREEGRVKGRRGRWKEGRRGGWKGEGWRDQKECRYRGSSMKALNGP